MVFERDRFRSSGRGTGLKHGDAEHVAKDLPVIVHGISPSCAGIRLPWIRLQTSIISTSDALRLCDETWSTAIDSTSQLRGRRPAFELQPAAEELFVSQAAVSRQIRRAGDSGRQAAVCPAPPSGRADGCWTGMLAQLTQSFDAIDHRLSEIQGRAGGGLVRVSTEPFFGGSWLMPRLKLFRKRTPA